jgi:hypothetical protein
VISTGVGVLVAARHGELSQSAYFSLAKCWNEFMRLLIAESCLALVEGGAAQSNTAVAHQISSGDG